MDDYDPASLLPEQATERIQSSVTPVSGFEKINLRAALDRVLAQDIRSRMDVPSHTNSAMDGYALHADALPVDDTREFKVVGTSWAGHHFQEPVKAGECVRIMTGAVMPEGTDTVIMQEHVEQTPDGIRIDARHKPGQNVRHAGEDIAVGDTVLRKGHRLIPADLGLLASLGTNEVMVTRRVRVAFFSTGDELRSIGDPLEPGMIYDSNRYTLYGMLTRLGVELIDLGVIPDTKEDTFRAFDQGAACADVLVTSGGVSVGEADFIKEALEQLGQIDFWKVAMKPGRPLAFGKIKDTYFFGLPGNPVSVMVTFYLFVQPALKTLQGERFAPPLLLEARCRSNLHKKAGRTEYQRGVLYRDADGQLVVDKTGPQGSGILTSMSDANCFIVLSLESETAEAGSLVQVLPFSEIV
jgi:molybdopterin molybdotransferase